MSESGPNEEVLGELKEAVGDGGFEQHADFSVDGVAFSSTVRPASPEALADTLAALDRCDARAVICGGRSHLGLGNPPKGASVLLSTDRLDGVLELDADDGVCRVAAGTTLADLRSEANANGWELPLDAPGAGATLGGVLATAAIGPRALGYGLPRDLVLGVDVALAGGERTRCGGRVVKNVTGYDLNKLYTGSLGSLGVIEAAWLRLRPVPEEVRVFEARMEPAAAIANGIEAARAVSARAVAVHWVPRDPARLVVELAGDAPSVRVGIDALGTLGEFSEALPGALDEVRARLTGVPGGNGQRFRLAALPSRLARLAHSLASRACELVIQPGLGLVHAGFSADDDAAFEHVSSLGVDWVLEAAPAALKRGRDVFGAQSETLPLMRAIKQQFDPDRRLNPGRFMGGL